MSPQNTKNKLRINSGHWMRLGPLPACVDSGAHTFTSRDVHFAAPSRLKSKLTHFLRRTRGHRSLISRSTCSVSSVTGRRADVGASRARTAKKPQRREWNSLKVSEGGSAEQHTSRSSRALSSSSSSALTPSTEQSSRKSCSDTRSLLLA